MRGVVAQPPGASSGSLVQQMDDDILALEIHNSSATFDDGAPTRLILLVSTRLSPAKGGAPTRALTVRLRDDVTSTRPLEPDAFQ